MSTYERLARSLIAYAARRAPPALSERLEEEWLADLAARHPGLARLRMALGCCWASSVIAREHGAQDGLATAAGGPAVMTHYVGQRSPLISPRAVALLLIASVHIALIYALATAVWQRVAEKAQTPLVAAFLPTPPRPQPPPPADPKITGISLDPKIVGTLPPPPKLGLVEITDVRPTGPALPPTAPPLSRVLGGPGPGFPSTDDFYPSGAIRAGLQGGTTIRVCVDASGRLTATPAVEQPSGSALLDAGALKLARAGSGHYRPTMEDGRAVSSCYPFRVRFQLR